MWRNIIKHSGRSLIKAPQLKYVPWCRLNSGCAANDPYDMSACFQRTEFEGVIRTSPFDPITIPNVQLHEYVWKSMHKWQDLVALVDGETNAETTYAQLRDICAAVAIRLQCPDLKLKPHDVLALSLPNCPEYVIASLGAIEGGFVISPVNPLYGSGELAAHIQRVNAKLFIIPLEIYPKVKKGLEMLELDIPIIAVVQDHTSKVPPEVLDFRNFSCTDNVDFCSLVKHDISPSSTVVMPSSSGTTGHPKAVLLSHNNITSNIEQTRVPFPHFPVIMATTETHQDVMPCILPFFHIYGFVLMLMLSRGVKLVTLRRFAPDTFLRSLTMHNGTILNVAPPIISFLANSPVIETSHLERIRVVICGAAAMPAPELNAFLEKVNRPELHFTQGYGMTETCIVSMNLHGATNYESTGVLLPSIEMKVVEENSTDGIGKELTETGEFWIRGPNVMSGYYNSPEATADMITADGWLKTGDAGHMDAKGYIHVTGRFKELIKVKGFQVASGELEDILLRHEDVVDAAVVGMPDKRSGETPVAVVVLSPKGKVNESDLIELVAEDVAEYKKLSDLVFVKEIPRNVTGKILRTQIKEELAEYYKTKNL